MSAEIFTEAWLTAWAAELNRSAAYREAASGWEGPIALIMEPSVSGPARRAYLDLWHGECREACAASERHVEAARYTISGREEVWRDILAGQVDLIMALARGKLKLQKGGWLTLARYAGAAREMVAAAGRIAGGGSAEEESAAGIRSSPGATATSATAVFATTSGRGLDHEALPMRLYQKAKIFGVWNPRDLDFRRDLADWEKLSELEHEVLLHLTSLFQAGEESVTQDILPLILVIARERRLEEELYLTTFLWEEAKHTEFFRRFLDEVANDDSDLSRFHGANYRRIFYDELPAAMNALLADSSPVAQVRAAVTYNMIVEGTLAETGYHAYYAMLERNQLLPGLREGIGYLKRDESRHIAYGLYLLARLLGADRSLWPALERRMSTLLEPALGVIHELFSGYETMPFGLVIDDFIEYALDQFQRRMASLERARDRGSLDLLAEIGGE